MISNDSQLSKFEFPGISRSPGARGPTGPRGPNIDRFRPGLPFLLKYIYIPWLLPGLVDLVLECPYILLGQLGVTEMALQQGEVLNQT